MAFVLPNSVLLHYPKTAGHWISSVLTDSGISVTPLRAHLHSRHLPEEQSHKFRFAFVRHPLTWYQSYFAHKMLRGWSNDHIDRNCHSSDFHQFVDNVLERFPQGYCSTVLCERHIDDANLVGLFERLKPDLIRALQLAGEEFDGLLIDSVLPKNVSNYQLLDIHYSTELRERVLEVEKGIIERFYR